MWLYFREFSSSQQWAQRLGWVSLGLRVLITTASHVVSVRSRGWAQREAES